MLSIYCNFIQKFSIAAIQPFSLSQPAVQKQTSAIQPFDFCRSKIFVSHSISAVQKFSSSVQPFDLIHSKIFLSRSTSSVQKFSSAVQLFSVSVLNSLWTCFLSVHLPCVQPFEWIPLRNVFVRGHIFLHISKQNFSEGGAHFEFFSSEFSMFSPELWREHCLIIRQKNRVGEFLLFCFFQKL